MNQAKEIMDGMDAAGQGLPVPVPQYKKPEGATAEDPEGRRFAKNKRKEAFLDRLYGTPART